MYYLHNLQEYLQSKQGYRVGLGVFAVAMFLLLITVAMQIFPWIQVYQQQQAVRQQPAVKVKSTEAPEFLNIYLFGKPTIQTVQTMTSSKLTVTGIYFADNKTLSSVVIRSDDTDKIYSVGDDVPGGYRVHEIKSDSVILSKGGVLQSLPLTFDQFLTQEPTATSDTSNSIPSQSERMERIRQNLFQRFRGR